VVEVGRQVITFLPEADFTLTAQRLDRLRLGKQRTEAKMLLQCIYDGGGAWSNHPAYAMWEESPFGLALYGITICEEWISRGYQDNQRDQIINLAMSLDDGIPIHAMTQQHAAIEHLLPLWLGQHNVHQSHKSNLIRKSPEHYREFWPSVPDNLPYHWPVPNNAKEQDA
jgi:hypothetical protein